MNAIKKNALFIISFAIILICALFFRINTFWLPHWIGDQCHYISLAMKLEKLGFAEYNLRAIKINLINLDNNNKIQLVYPTLMANKESKGDVLTALHLVGIHYYDQDLFHKPPGFPLALMLSHKIFAKPNQPYVVVLTNLANFLKRIRPKVFLQAQFWAVIMPLFFNLGLISLTILLGRIIFSPLIGLLAGILMAIHPVSIFNAHKIWPDDMVGFFCLLSISIILLIKKYRINSYWAYFFAGIICGLGVLAKQTGLIIFLAIIAYFTFKYVAQLKNIGDKNLSLFKKYTLNLLLYGIGILVVTGFWFWRVYKTYGNPFWLPVDKNVLQTDISGWFRTISSRPPGWILYPVGIVWMCPLFVFSLLSLKELFNNIKNYWQGKNAQNSFIVICWFIILTFYIVLGNNREHRRLIVIYPYLSLLAAYMLSYLLSFKKIKKLGSWDTYYLRITILIICIILVAIRSVPLGIQAALQEALLLKIPF